MSIPAQLSPIGATYNTKYYRGPDDTVVVMPDMGLKDDAASARVNNVLLEAATVRVPVTASVGVVEWIPGEKLEGTLRRADEALYAAKTAGRNCVIAHGCQSEIVVEQPE